MPTMCMHNNKYKQDSQTVYGRISDLAVAASISCLDEYLWIKLVSSGWWSIEQLTFLLNLVIIVLYSLPCPLVQHCFYFVVACVQGLIHIIVITLFSSIYVI